MRIESLGPSRRLVSRKQGTSRTNLNNFYIRFPPSLRVVEKLLNCPRPSHATSLSTPQVLVLVPLCPSGHHILAATSTKIPIGRPTFHIKFMRKTRSTGRGLGSLLRVRVPINTPQEFDSVEFPCQ